jgi:CHAT domain-containing protein
MVKAVITLAVAGLAIGSTAFAADGGSLDLGRDLSGQECRAEPRFSVRPDPSLPMPVDIHCGKQQQPIGGIEASPLSAPLAETGAALNAAMDASAGSRAMDLRMTCAPGELTMLAGRPASIASCALRTGGWRSLRIGLAAGRTLIQGDITPAALPVFERAVRRMLGEDAVADLPDETVRRVRQGLGGDTPTDTGAQAASYQQILENARIDNAAGNHAGAELAYRQALDLQTKGLTRDDPAMGDTVMRLALEVSNQGRFAEAQSLFKRAEPLIARSPDPLDGPRFSLYLAMDAMSRHQYREARDLARRAGAAFAVIAGSGGTANAALAQGEAAHSLMIEAAAASRLRDWTGAEAAAASALHAIDRAPGLPPSWKPDAMVLLGEAEGRLGRVESGQSLIKDAIARITKLFGPSRPTATSWLALGRVYAENGRYPLAIEAFATGLDPVHGVTPLGFETLSPYFSASLDWAAQADDRRESLLDGVFRGVQRVQSLGGDDAVSRVAVQLAAADPALAELVGKVNDADRMLAETRLQLAEENAKPEDDRDRPRIAWLSQELNAVLAEKAATEKALGTASPDYARLATRIPPDVSQIRSQLGADEGFVTFTFGQDFGVAILITPKTIQGAKIALSADQVAGMVTGLRQAMVIRANKADPFDAGLAHRLYGALFGQLEPALADIKHLHVAAPGPLASLPLALLVTAPPTHWLAERLAITEWPSARAFATLRHGAKPSAASRPFLGIGDPLFRAASGGAVGRASDLCRSDGPFPADLLAALPALPDTGAEVNRVGALLGAAPADVLTGANATEAAVRSRPLRDYRVLYFATHGLLPTESRCLSQPGLALSPPQAAATKETDGLLEATEIAALKLDAELVVLSACNTATTTGQFSGHALSSLAESFFHAGARSVLATHWSVPSKPSTALMTALFRHHGTAGDYAEDLRQAQMELIRDPATAHPINWAAFTLIGGTGGGLPR